LEVQEPNTRAKGIHNAIVEMGRMRFEIKKSGYTAIHLRDWMTEHIGPKNLLSSSEGWIFTGEGWRISWYTSGRRVVEIDDESKVSLFILKWL